MSQNNNNNRVTFFQPKALLNRRQQPSTTDHFSIREVAIAGSGSRQEHTPPRRHVGSEPSANASAARTEPSKDEDKFSDYIRKVKGKMRSISGVGDVKIDSFNDRVSHYIDRTKSKMRRGGDGSLE